MSAAGADTAGTDAARRCRQCGAALSADEVGLTRKLLDRGARTFLCIGCLAAFFGCDEARLRQKAEQFRREGCVLFVPRAAAGEGAAGEGAANKSTAGEDAAGESAAAPPAENGGAKGL